MDTGHIFNELRRKIAGSDQFMTGHQILTDRTGYSRLAPEWTKSKFETGKLLINTFPKYRTNALQKARMLRWSQIIHRYWRLQNSAGEIAEDFKIPLYEVKNYITRIKHAAAGLNTAGNPRGLPGPRRSLEEVRAFELKLLNKLFSKTPRGRGKKRHVPSWARNPKLIARLLNSSFPRRHTRARESAQANRWAKIIHLYFIKRETRDDVAKILGLKDSQVRATLSRIKRAQAGKNTAGHVRTQCGSGNRRPLKRARQEPPLYLK
jgi:hypothetical protein